MAETNQLDVEAVEIKLDVTLKDVNVMLNALAELPFKVTVDLIGKIRSQAQAQVDSLQQPAPPAPTE